MFHQLVFLLCCLIAFAEHGSSQDTPSLAFTLGTVSLRSSHFTLDLGIQVDKRPTSVSLRVRNLLATSQSLDVFKNAPSIDIRWSKPNDKMGLRSRTMLEGGDEQTLVITLMPSSTEREAPVVTFISSNNVVASFGISYRIDSPEKARKTGGEYWTPYGLEGQRQGSKAHYQLCTGTPPVGYHLKENSLVISSQTVSGGHPRSCGQWMDCTPVTPIVDGNICYAFDIEGHWKGANLTSSDENDHLKVAVHMTWTYSLDEQVPILTPWR